MSREESNVVIVVLDTVRAFETVPADQSGLPAMASLAADGTEFCRAFTSAPWTLPSHAGLLTGTYTSKHDTHGENPMLDESLTVLPEILSEHGYETRAISNNTWFSDEFGFDRGFDTFHTTWTRDADESGVGPSGSGFDADDWRARATEDCTAEATTNVAVDWLTSMGSEPFFLFLNYIDAHFEYCPPREYVTDELPPGYDYDSAVDVLDSSHAYSAESESLTDSALTALRALYLGELAYLDDNISRLVDRLKRAGEWEDTILLLTSDHGENIGEHGLVGHQYSLYDTVLHVPLVVTGGSFDSGTSTNRLVQLIDIPSTILDEVGIGASTARGQFQGRSFSPSSSAPEREFVTGEHVTTCPPIETLKERFGDLPESLEALEDGLPLRAIRTDEYKLVMADDGASELYQVRNDPGETEDIAERHEDVCDRLREDLERWVASFEQETTQASTTISSESKKRLQDLGYL
jgi:arylsulfatase A-like enzyme